MDYGGGYGAVVPVRVVIVPIAVALFFVCFPSVKNFYFYVFYVYAI